MMNDRQAKNGEDLKEVEMEGPLHEGAGQTQGQRQRIATQLSIRLATPHDADGLRGMFSRVSPETIYRRFHAPYRDVPERTLVLMLDVDHHDKESLVALAEEEIVGHAMYARLGFSREAEVAFVVEDGWQSKGVGKLLLSQIAEEARFRGVETFTGAVLGENRRVLSFLNAVFADVEYVIRDGLYHFRVPLQTLKVAADSLQILQRAA